jgi:hypothetical protein
MGQEKTGTDRLRLENQDKVFQVEEGEREALVGKGCWSRLI